MLAFAEKLYNDIRQAVLKRVSDDKGINTSFLEQEQRATHGLAWAATALETIRQLEAYKTRMTEISRFGEIESLLVEIGIKETLVLTNQ